MPEPLKLMYNAQFFEQLCPVLTEVIPGFKERAFIHRVFDNRWPDLELKQRTTSITVALRQFMPSEFPCAAEKIVEVSRILRLKEKVQSYPFIFLPEYIELYGQADFDVAMDAIEEVTKLVSAEFAIRPFILAYPRQTMKQMILWSKHPDASVRRLASEGCRPRLPWASRLHDFKNDPAPILPILENLKNDPSEYVRRSVANNLNDIAKDHPDLVLKTVAKWKGKNPDTQWIIKHGCRTLLKNGNETALQLHGFETTSNSRITDFAADKNITVGSYLNFNFTFSSDEKKKAFFRLEYAIHYVTATGKVALKVFKIGEYWVEPTKLLAIKRRQSFVDLTTRKHFKGKHRLAIIVNGTEKASCNFQVK